MHKPSASPWRPIPAFSGSEAGPGASLVLCCAPPQVVELQEIKQHGTLFAKDVFDPTGYPASDFYDTLREDPPLLPRPWFLALRFRLRTRSLVASSLVASSLVASL